MTSVQNIIEYTVFLIYMFEFVRNRVCQNIKLLIKLRKCRIVFSIFTDFDEGSQFHL